LATSPAASSFLFYEELTKGRGVTRVCLGYLARIKKLTNMPSSLLSSNSDFSRLSSTYV